MPVHVIHLAMEMLQGIRNPTITLLDLAYKANVDDTRESPAFKIKKIAESEGLSVKIYDPLVKDYSDNSSTIQEATRDSDCLALETGHDVFKDVNPQSLPVRNKNLIDTRNILGHALWRKAGYKINILGTGNI